MRYTAIFQKSSGYDTSLPYSEDIEAASLSEANALADDISQRRGTYYAGTYVLAVFLAEAGMVGERTEQGNRDRQKWPPVDEGDDDEDE